MIVMVIRAWLCRTLGRSHSAMDLRSLSALPQPSAADAELHNRVGVELTTPEGHTYHVGRLTAEDRRHKILRCTPMLPQTPRWGWLRHVPRDDCAARQPTTQRGHTHEIALLHCSGVIAWLVAWQSPDKPSAGHTTCCHQCST